MTTDEPGVDVWQRFPTRQVAVGFGVALVLLVGLLVAVDWRAVGVELSGADPVVAVLAPAVILVAFACYSEAQRRLLWSAGVELPRRGMWLRYMAAAGTRMVVPMGQAAGPAILAYAVRSAADDGTEQAFAATTVGGLASHAAQLSLASVGLVLVAQRGGGRLAWLVGIAVVVLATTLVSLALLVQFRRGALRRLVGLVALAGQATVGRVSGRAHAALSPGAITSRIDRFAGAIDAIADRPRTVATAFALHATGWTLAAGALSAALLALGRPDLVALAPLLVPTAGLIAMLPLPGGLGGVEVALTALLVEVGDIAAAVAAAAVLLYRLAAYWFVVAVGATALGVLAIGWAAERDGD